MELEQIDQNFGPTVRLVRQERDMSQEELATAVSKLGYQISQATVGKIERGDRKVTIGEAEAIARALQTSTTAFILGPSYITREVLSDRLRILRRELVDAMRVYESGQQLVAIESRDLDEYDQEWLRSLVLESLEEIVADYRKDKTSENDARRHRDEMDGPVGEHLPDGLFGEYESKFGNRVERFPQPKAWQTILKRSPEEPHG
jgi:transcriptional regulator with XRE-family HTH domain